jgi:biopolymer transport protein ExbB
VDASFREYLRRGGDVAHVIVGLGVVALVLVLLRAVILARTTKDPAALLDAVAPLVAAGRLDEALARCKATRGAAARVVEAMLPFVCQGAGSEKLESAAQERMVQEALRFERFETAILVSAAVAPLLGLLGTVTGMIATFDIITIYGTGDPKLLAGGISEALITTELGLEVAIPTLLLGNLLSSWTEGVRASMERAALRVSLFAQKDEGAA